jgi:hypothetical protein
LHLASPPPRFGYSALTPGDPARPYRGTPGTDRDFLLSTALGSSHERARVGFHAGWFGRLRRNPRPSIPIKNVTKLDGSGTLTNETLSITASKTCPLMISWKPTVTSPDELTTYDFEKFW